MAERKKITKDMLISDLVGNYPEAMPILFQAGFHCVGCALAAQETIEQGAIAHGMDADELVKALNKAVEEAKKAEKKG